jgi:hypothetical protein
MAELFAQQHQDLLPLGLIEAAAAVISASLRIFKQYAALFQLTL